MKKNNRQNYLDYIPVKNPDIESHINEEGKAVLLIEWNGFYHKNRPAVLPPPQGQRYYTG